MIMNKEEIQSLIQLAATLVGILGGLLGLYQYFSDKREKELREWQKVVIYKIFRQNETKPFGFTEILEKYRIEANAFVDIDLKKKEMSEDALRRVLLELCGSDILSMEPQDSFKLNVTEAKYDPQSTLQQINKELVNMVGANPYVYTLDEVLKELSAKVGVAIPLLRTDLKQAIAAGTFALDEQGRIAFAR
jgi:hypothetical protein